ncbi:MAG: MBL fold metallo-hydrolase [Bdellovibrio sp.]|nr:MBL fold metallo-hydrolase [Bdellovibrio sp.]
MILKEIVVGPFQCNCKILACPKTGEAVIIDPGDESKEILKYLKNLKTPFGQDLKVKYLFHTHAHLDHIAATRDVRENQVSSKIALHKNDEVLYQQLKMQGGFFGLNLSDPLPVEHYFVDEEVISVGSLKFSIIHTPGHSPGSVSIRLHENSESNVKEMLFSGDTLFQGSIGRTDLWGGDFDVLIKSIRQRIFSLDDDIPVCPGHGPNTLVGIEKRENPFCS